MITSYSSRIIMLVVIFRGFKLPVVTLDSFLTANNVM